MPRRAARTLVNCEDWLMRGGVYPARASNPGNGASYNGQMRCALECPIEAKIRLTTDIDVPWFNHKRLIIKRDPTGHAALIRIEGPVQPEDMISMLVERLPNGITHFNGAGGLQIRHELEEELQLIESTLGLYCKLSRVRWEFATSIAIPESSEEESTIQWNNFRMSPPEPNA